MKSTKRSLIMSALSLVVCVTMLLGTTFAWFTNNVTSGRNKIVAGNLDVELTHSNAKVTTPENVQDSTDLFKFEKVENSYKEVLWEPGMVVYENFTVSNVGKLALKYALNLNVYDKNSLITAGVEHDLTEAIKVAVIKDGFSGERADAQGLTFTTLADFQKQGNLVGKNGDTVDSDTYGVVLYWEPTDHDNLYNVTDGNSVETSVLGVTAENAGNALFIEFGVNLVATQDTVEADSFDKQYDATAPLAVMSKPMTKKLASTESLKIVVPEEAESSVKEASVPAAVANAVFDKVFTDSTTSDKSLTLVLSVEEKSKTDTTFNYEIDMDAVIKEVSGSTVIKNETKSVNDLGLELTDFVEVQMNIAPGLLNVNVKHNGNDMKEVADLAAAKAFTPEVAAGYFNYHDADGLTKLWTKTFSPFVINGEVLSVDYLNNKLSSISKNEWTMPYYIFREAGISDSNVRFAYENGYKVFKVTCTNTGSPRRPNYVYTYSFATSVSNKNYDFNLVSDYTELKTKDVYAEAVELGTQASYTGYQGYVSIDSYTNGNFYLLDNFDMKGNTYIAMNSCNNCECPRSFDVGPNKNITFNVFGINMAQLYGANWKDYLPVHYIRTNGGVINLLTGTGNNAYIVHYGNPSTVNNYCGEANTSYTEKGPNQYDN